MFRAVVPEVITTEVGLAAVHVPGCGMYMDDHAALTQVIMDGIPLRAMSVAVVR